MTEEKQKTEESGRGYTLGELAKETRRTMVGGKLGNMAMHVGETALNYVFNPTIERRYKERKEDIFSSTYKRVFSGILTGGSLAGVAAHDLGQLLSTQSSSSEPEYFVPAVLSLIGANAASWVYENVRTARRNFNGRDRK